MVKMLACNNHVAIEGKGAVEQQELWLQVLARSSPADKFKLVKLLKESGEVVAVTGDGEQVHQCYQNGRGKGGLD